MTQTRPAPGDSLPPWRILRGLTIPGFLLALPGGLLPLWGFHMRPDLGTAANDFLALGAGLTAGAALAAMLRDRFPMKHILAGGCFTGAVALLLLSVAAPPAAIWYQALSLLVTGAAAGIVNTAVFESIAFAWEGNPARITLTAGAFFGLGSILAAWLLSLCFDPGTATRALSATALLPALAGVAFGRVPLVPAPVAELPVGDAIKDLRSVLAVLFALLLFFQFASEWSLAGWLPVFLIDRLGVSPQTAVTLLAGYWLALTVGRVATARMLTSVPHGRLLGTSAFCALFGCIALAASGTRFGVYTGIFLTGAGFSAIYPLAAERIRTRFSYYHPGYFNGIFTFAMLGGILSPFALGHLAAAAGLRVVPLAALVGSCAVFALVLLIWLGRKVSGS